MALDKATLIQDLKAIFEDLDPNSTPLQKAQSMADAIDTFVKTGSVSSNGSTSPTVTGSPATITNLPGTIS